MKDEESGGDIYFQSMMNIVQRIWPRITGERAGRVRVHARKNKWFAPRIRVDSLRGIYFL